jgi:hypothetical protein
MEEEGTRVRVVESFFVVTAFKLIIVRWSGKRNEERKRAISVTKLHQGGEEGEGFLSIHIWKILIKHDETFYRNSINIKRN